MNNDSPSLAPFLRKSLFLLAFAPLCPIAAEENARPNVLLILTDDQGYGDLSFHGNPYLETPHIDRLGEASIRADNFYVSPVCAPTRASLLTGRYHPRTGSISVTRRMEAMNPDEVTLAEVFKANDYTTGCFGKWHNGAFYPETPNGQGFDEFTGFLYGVIDRYFDPPLKHNDTDIQPEGYITDILTDAAIDFMKTAHAEGTPYFCYVPYNAPHTPGLAPEELINKYRARGLSEVDSAVYAMMESIDSNVGRLLNYLEDTGQADNTVVIFLSDNGPVPFRYNAGMLGRKGWFDEGGVRVPFFIRWPDGLAGNFQIDERLMHIDLLPTLVELCGLESPEKFPLDGRSFHSLLTEPQAAWPDRLLYFFPFGDPQYAHRQGAVRTHRWLAVINRQGNWSLYDLIEDPLQTREVSAANPWVFDYLTEAYQKAFKEIYADSGQTPIPVGYPGHPEVLIEGHDANLIHVEDGGIAYNFPAGFANHWVSGWTNAGAWPEWNLFVHTAGTYAIALQYNLKSASPPLHATIESRNDSLDFVLDQPFLPVTIPQPFFLPGEASKYESRHWKMLPVGTIKLKEGQTPLRLKLDEIPNSADLEIKGVRLTLQEGGRH